MALKEMTSKYIEKAERVFKELDAAPYPSSPKMDRVKEVIKEAKRYLEDAKYYLGKERFDTSLASIAYCEGILDALRMLGFVEFLW
jgi:FAD synthetase